MAAYSRPTSAAANGAAVATLIIGVLALQGGFLEHINLVNQAATQIYESGTAPGVCFRTLEVRTPAELARCNGLIIPGGESTTISLVASQSGLLGPLRNFVRTQKKPTWGTCAGLILLSEQVNATKQGGQELIGGLDVRVHRNHFGRQIESFVADLSLPFLGDVNDAHFPGVFIRAPVVEEILPPTVSKAQTVEILAKLAGRVDRMKPGYSHASTKNGSGDIIAVKQDNVLGTSFHPELTSDARIHVWWMQNMLST